MGMFRRKKKATSKGDGFAVEQAPNKQPADDAEKRGAVASITPSAVANMKQSTTATPSPPPTTTTTKRGADKKHKKKHDSSNNIKPTLDMVPSLIQDLENATDTASEIPARALRLLFQLSEQQTATTSTADSTRIAMVQSYNKALVPALLSFLQRCERGSSEQYLCLLVLNNISIPMANKTLIAVACVTLLSELLVYDPSCHLITIILVNLSFCDATLRSELCDARNRYELVEAISFALRVSTLSESEYEERIDVIESENNNNLSSTGSQLAALMTLDRQLRRKNNRTAATINSNLDMIYPETAKWCCAALKNLTRVTTTSTSSDNNQAAAAHILIKMGVLDVILQLVRVRPSSSSSSTRFLNDSRSSNDSPTPRDPFHDSSSLNAPPFTWQPNTMQDAALFVIMNVASHPKTRHAVKDLHGIEILSSICQYQCDLGELSDGELFQLQFQIVKARMTLAYLLGSEGHFGQSVAKHQHQYDDSVLVLSSNEVEVLIEMLANTLNGVGKEGGYSAATFHTKSVLYAIRCLMTKSVNQTKFATERLNTLLLKALAQYCLEQQVDAEAAEYAVWSLYLQSNYGFRSRFLPAMFGNQDKIAGTGSRFAKILTMYLHSDGITPAGRHAADQLFLRMRYLDFSGAMAELATRNGLPASAFLFDDSLLQAIDLITEEKRRHGARPDNDIFDRPILRTKVGKSSIYVFPNALSAVQPLSFGSTRLRHETAMIDDVLIANNIASRANGEEKAESYHYSWKWQDFSMGKSLPGNLLRRPSESSIMSNMSKLRSQNNENEPISIFGLRCLPLCGRDTT